MSYTGSVHIWPNDRNESLWHWQVNKKLWPDLTLKKEDEIQCTIKNGNCKE